LEVARAIEYLLHEDCEVTLWNEGVFGLGQTTLEALVNALERFDFAVLVLTPDDVVLSRNVERLAPRDNLMFELGLFMGRLGRSRTFVVCERSEQMKLPSDLAGVTIARFDRDRQDGNLIAALGPSCSLVRKSIKDLGISELRSARHLENATTQVEGISEKMTHLVNLLARSRILELDVIDKQLGFMLPADFLENLRKDLQDLAEATKNT
jgi:hypothetical protein